MRSSGLIILWSFLIGDVAYHLPACRSRMPREHQWEKVKEEPAACRPFPPSPKQWTHHPPADRNDHLLVVRTPRAQPMCLVGARSRRNSDVELGPSGAHDRCRSRAKLC